MGKSITPKYRLEIDGQKQGWLVKEYGKPTKKNLEKYVYDYAKSLEFGGINHHISRMLKYIPYPNYARIVLNKPSGYGDILIVDWKAHIFQAW